MRHAKSNVVMTINTMSSKQLESNGINGAILAEPMKPLLTESHPFIPFPNVTLNVLILYDFVHTCVCIYAEVYICI